MMRRIQQIQRENAHCRPPVRALGRVAIAGVAAALVLAGPGCIRDELQGTLPPGAQVDTYSQVSVTKVDVLWVVDNSGSMAQEQANLARNFGRFFEFFSKAKVDYHIGITTTDIVKDAGKLVGSPPVIDPTTPNPLTTFANSIKVGTNGSANEAGLDAARRTFELRPAGFLREDAYLFIVFVSDEDDKSAPGTPQFFYRYFESLKGKGNEGMVTAGAIIGDVPNGCSSPDDGYHASPGTRYQEVVEKVGGRVGSICDPQFDGILREMGIDAVGLKRKFQLSKVPDPTSLQVTVTYACDTADEDLAHCDLVDRDCASGGAGIRCEVRPVPERLDEGCELDPEALAGRCARTQSFCEPVREAKYVWCWPQNPRDGWEYEQATGSIVFTGAAVPPKGAGIEFIYLPPPAGTGA